MQSYIFDFRKSTSFMTKGWNKEFDVADLGANCFYIALVDDNCANNFSDCINADGQLIYNESHMVMAECELEYDVVRDSVENIVLADDCSFEFAEDELLPDSFNMKGAFLLVDDRYVMGYSINNYSVNITTQMVFEKGLIFYNVIEGGLSGE